MPRRSSMTPMPLPDLRAALAYRKRALAAIPERVRAMLAEVEEVERRLAEVAGGGDSNAAAGSDAGTSKTPGTRRGRRGKRATAATPAPSTRRGRKAKTTAPGTPKAAQTAATPARTADAAHAAKPAADAPTAARAPRKRPRPAAGADLASLLAKILAVSKTPKSIADLTTVVVASGYTSTSRNLARIVGMKLAGDRKRFKRVEHGRYVANAAPGSEADGMAEERK